MFKTTQRHIPQDGNLNIHFPNTTKSHTIGTCLPICALLRILFIPYINLIASAGDGSTGDDDVTVARVL